VVVDHQGVQELLKDQELAVVEEPLLGHLLLLHQVKICLLL
jgi:hypothetical protein